MLKAVGVTLTKDDLDTADLTPAERTALKNIGSYFDISKYPPAAQEERRRRIYEEHRALDAKSAQLSTVDSGVMRLLQVELDALAKLCGYKISRLKRLHKGMHGSWADPGNVDNLEAWVKLLREYQVK